MKKRYLILLLTFIFMLSTQICMAEMFCTQRADTDIFVLRYPLTNKTFTEQDIVRESQRQYIEFQRTVDYNAKDKIYIHIRTYNNPFKYAKIVNPSNGKSILLKEVNLNHDFYLPKTLCDKWFTFNKIDWDKLELDMTINQSLNCILTDSNNTLNYNFSMKNKNLQKLTESNENNLLLSKALSLHSRFSYDPSWDSTFYYRQDYFSVFFPKQNYNNLKNFIFYEMSLDQNYSHSSKIAVDDTAKIISIETQYSQNFGVGSQSLHFVETNNGTWINFIPNYLKFIALPSEGYIDKNYYYLFDIIKKTYQGLYGYRLYGFELHPYEQRNNDKLYVSLLVNTKELQPLIENSNKNDVIRLTKVNGSDVRFLIGLIYDEITIYENNGKPVKFTFFNERTKETFSAYIKPTKLIFSNYSKMSFQNSEKLLKDISPLDMNTNAYRFFDIFDPTISSSENIVFYSHQTAYPLSKQLLTEFDKNK